MAGHSKWANIQHRKNRQDAKRGSLWTKIIREVTIAAREAPAVSLHIAAPNQRMYSHDVGNPVRQFFQRDE